MTDQICPCRQTSDDKRAYKDCCAPYIEQDQPAPTAEALMRSRYSAFAVENIDYLERNPGPTLTYAAEAAALLDGKGIRHQFLETEGDHSWPIWRNYLVEFTPKLFR